MTAGIGKDGTVPAWLAVIIFGSLFAVSLAATVILSVLVWPAERVPSGLFFGFLGSYALGALSASLTGAILGSVHTARRANTGRYDFDRAAVADSRVQAAVLGTAAVALALVVRTLWDRLPLEAAGSGVFVIVVMCLWTFRVISRLRRK
ncbi:hypothetical protein [Microlunatus speluncae]|uniref:hypothetical protein n=1 Tax=Microlunatus speluncae TaxID=2594267 RepID=UPI00126629BF|nr:hypothetical protein [Microlunatus speluncae]